MRSLLPTAPVPRLACSLLALVAGLLLTAAASAQRLAGAPDAPTHALQHVRSQPGQLGILVTDANELVVRDAFVSGHTGVSHVHIGQTIGGIEVWGALVNVAVTADSLAARAACSA